MSKMMSRFLRIGSVFPTKQGRNKLPNLEDSMNYSSTVGKTSFKLTAILMTVVGIFSNENLSLAQSANVTQAGQGDLAQITIGVGGSITYIVHSNTYQPIRIVRPQYPERAAQRGVAGWALLSFSVTEDGNVNEDTIVVVDSEPPEIFDRESISAAARLKYQPRTLNGTKVGVSGINYLFRYELESRGLAISGSSGMNREYLPLNYITPKYPLEASSENVEGYVLVEFTVTDKGLPSGIVILDRSPSSIFNESAVNAAERFRFEPRIVNGEPVEAVGAQYLFTFELED